MKPEEFLELTMEMPILKMHGLGNDFVVMHHTREDVSPDLVQRLCDRNYGVGADGLVLVMDPTDQGLRDGAQIRMGFYNPDGTDGQMCGNGIRCFTRYLVLNNLVSGTHPVHVETGNGIVSAEIVGQNGTHESMVKVNMGAPSFTDDEQFKPDAGCRKANGMWQTNILGNTYFFVSMGNPHAVCIGQKVEAIPLHNWGTTVQQKSVFPKSINVEYVGINAFDDFRMRVYERGAGETKACGTGACASFVAAVMLGRLGESATAHLDGGDLELSWEKTAQLDEPVYMTGPARTCYTVTDWQGMIEDL